MRFSAGTVANAAAWAVLDVLIAVAFVTVNLLGPAGFVILGLFVLFICTAVNLYEDAPTWGTEVFKARIASHGSPEQRAAMFDEKHASLSPFGFTAGAALCWWVHLAAGQQDWCTSALRRTCIDVGQGRGIAVPTCASLLCQAARQGRLVQTSEQYGYW
jgi:hypothetical protein